MTHRDNRFGRALRELRRSLDRSQLVLAKELGTTQRHLSFLETGRSQPTRKMIGRIVTGLSLSVGQRAALFEASGFTPPSGGLDEEAPAVTAALDLLETRLLAVWPYPAFLMDQAWHILRVNAEARSFLEGLGFSRQPSMFEVLLSPTFREISENWEAFSMAFFFRLQAAAARSPELSRLFEEARGAGVFAHVPHQITHARAPALVPAILRGGDGRRMVLTSIVGGLVTAQDAELDALQVELVVPLDDDTARALAGP